MSFVVIAQTDQIPIGIMKSFSVEGNSVLVTNIEGKYYCIGSTCTHAGGDLSKGQLVGKIVKCPRHGSQFEVTTGLRIAGPAKNNEPAYEVKVEKTNISIKI